MKKNIILAVSLILLLAIFFGIGFARRDVPGRTPNLVNDYAGVMTDSSKRDLENLLKDMRDNKPMHTEVVISTFKSLNGKSFDEFFMKYLRAWWHWPILERHNRIQVVVIVEDGIMRIGVGAGIDKIVTNEMTDSIMREVMIPEFKRGNYGSGIKSGAEAIVDILDKAGAGK